jgi:hypothetical protein
MCNRKSGCVTRRDVTSQDTGLIDENHAIYSEHREASQHHKHAN